MYKIKSSLWELPDSEVLMSSDPQGQIEQMVEDILDRAKYSLSRLECKDNSFDLKDIKFQFEAIRIVAKNAQAILDGLHD